jgi:hypothetical protein
MDVWRRRLPANWSARRLLGFGLNMVPDGRTQHAFARRAGGRRLGWSGDGPAERGSNSGFGGEVLGRSGRFGRFDAGRGLGFHSGCNAGRGFYIRGGRRLLGLGRGSFFHHRGSLEKVLPDLVDQVAFKRARVGFLVLNTNGGQVIDDGLGFDLEFPG